MEDLGLQYDFVAYSDIEREGLDRFRLLIMPYSQAVSRREAKQIAAFVRSGGTVLADLYPAVRDKHCKPTAQGLLDEVLGVRSDSADRPTFQLATVVGEQVPQDLQLQAGCAKVQLTGATAQAHMPGLAKAPAWITNQFGRGRAVLLNACFAGYSGCRLGGTGGEIAVVTRAKMAVRRAVSDFARRVLASAGLEPSVRITTADDEPYLDAEVVRYVQGAATYVGVLPSADPGGMIRAEDSEPVTVDFGRRAHVYELRTGQYFGAQRTITTKLTRGVARVYALTPDRMEPLRLSVLGTASRRKGVRVLVQAKDLGVDRVGHLTVTGPDGRALWLYARDLIVRDGRAEWAIPLALSDPSGKWAVVVRDPVDGQSAVASFVLP